jgi:hypothetical protein
MTKHIAAAGRADQVNEKRCSHADSRWKHAFVASSAKRMAWKAAEGKNTVKFEVAQVRLRNLKDWKTYSSDIPPHIQRTELCVVSLSSPPTSDLHDAAHQSGLAPKVHFVIMPGIARYMHSSRFMCTTDQGSPPRISAFALACEARSFLHIFAKCLIVLERHLLCFLGDLRPGVEATTLVRSRHPPRDTHDPKKEVSCRCCCDFGTS